MKKTLTIIAAGLFNAISGSLGAQDLVKVVEAEREIQPQLRAAARPEIYPELHTGQFTATPLQPSLKLHNVAVAPVPPVFTMPSLLDTLYKPSPWRGYAAAAWFPAADLSLSAGYSLLRGKQTDLRAWIQGERQGYDARTYNGNIEHDYDYMQGTVGLNLNTLVHPNAMLRATTSLRGRRWNLMHDIMTESHQGLTDYRLGATLASRGAGIFDYAVAGGMQYYGLTQLPLTHDYINDKVELPGHGLREVNYNLGLHGAWHATDNSQLSLDVDLQGMHIGQTYYTSYSNELFMPHYNAILLNKGGSLDYNVFTILPGYVFRGNHSAGYVKLRCAIATGGGRKERVYLSVDSRYDWNWRKYITIGGFTSTGTTLNTLGVVTAASPYATVMCPAGEMRHGDVGIGMTIGPIRGFAFTASYAYAGADNVATTCISNGIPRAIYQEVYAMLLTLKASYIIAPWLQIEVSNRTAMLDDAYYYRWDDHARNVFDIKLTGKPIESLTISAGYERRTGRRLDTEEYKIYPDGRYDYHYILAGIGNVSNLSLDAEWNMTEQLGFNVSVSGLTQGAYTLPCGIAGRRLRGSIGVTYKF